MQPLPFFLFLFCTFDIKYSVNRYKFKNMKVTLRTKPIQDSKLRLYLDFYPPITNQVTGKATRREFLSLYVYSETELKEEKYLSNDKELIRIVPVLDSKKQPKKIRLNQLQRQHNKETYELAENIKAQRQLQIQSEDYGFLTIDRHADFLLYFKEMADKQKENKGDNNYLSTYHYLDKFTNGNCPASRITPSFCEGFKEFLLNTKAFEGGRANLSNNTLSVYYANFLNVLKNAIKDKLLTEDSIKDVKRIKRVENKQREFLTGEELQKLVTIPCDLPELKNACMFSALAGLRWGDVEKLTWNEVFEDNKIYYIRFITQKTDRAETLPISAEAYSFLGERKTINERVFPSIKYSAWQNTHIDKWIRAAGINKHITFHCFRHTYATLQITLGTDIYTVSKMLGHRDIATTQIYARIMDKTKIKAANIEMIKL